jgi:flagellar biosynthesis activator protein FlaF
MLAMQIFQEVEAMPVEVAEPSSGRQLEADVLNKAAAMLEDVVGRWQEDTDHAMLDSALRYNQALWGVFQAELVSPENQLPEALKQNILSLSQFVDKRTFDVIAYPEPGKLDILIKINRGIAEGLAAH